MKTFLLIEVTLGITNWLNKRGIIILCPWAFRSIFGIYVLGGSWPLGKTCILLTPSRHLLSLPPFY